ncbi:hypothetical protein [Pseudomonas sp. PH1b]|uniref:hypothetical protein n=1 Tax=Pseudomonas sp. PH1b TaxID=1397282 RepID=UPI0012FEC71A|nr:hypothetical protein [Pseudomonas sp. PH1b]
MKLPPFFALLTFTLLLPSIAQSSDTSLVDTLRAFSRCDASFFSSLETHSDA